MTTVSAPVSGVVVPLEEVDDEVFAGRVVGDGVALRPSDGRVVAPLDGRVEKVFPGGHGIAIESSEGLQVLVHVGLETVQLEGDGFDAHVAEGDEVTEGDPLVTVDLARLAELGVDAISPVVVMSGESVEVVASGSVVPGDPLLKVGEA